MQCIRVVLFLLVYVYVLARANWVYDDEGCRTPDLGSGSCVAVNDCRFISELVDRTHDSAAAKDIVKKYLCGVDYHRNPKVCCPGSDQEDYSKHKNLKLLPTEECGDVRAWGLFNGNMTNVFEFGWQALLKYQKPGDPYLCGGTLINKRYVLTAGHCIKNKYHLTGVRLGEYNIETDPDCTEEYKGGSTFMVCAPPYQDFDVENTSVHPQYDAATLSNNVGLIRLKGEANTNLDTVTPICLPITAAVQQHKNMKYTAIGWGARKNGLGNMVLLKVLTPKVERYICNHEYNINLSDKQFCGGGVEKYDSCAGDDGGALMGYYYNGHELKTILYGIVSTRSSDCEEKNFPAVYTEVASYVGWILDNIQP